MYITYMFNWLYDILQLPVPIVLSDNIYSMVTIFDLLMFSIYIAIFIILIRYIITDSLSFSVGGYSMNYSSSAYLPSHFKAKRIKKRKEVEKIQKGKIKKEKIESKKANKKESK